MLMHRKENPSPSLEAVEVDRLLFSSKLTSTLSTSVMTIGLLSHISEVKFLCEQILLEDTL